MPLTDDAGILGGSSGGKLVDDAGIFAFRDQGISPAGAEKQMKSIEGGTSEIEPASEDPITAMQKHPYATGAIAGAALGPTIPAIAAATEGAPLLASAAGAAEQTAYTAVADLAARAAGPNHPYLGLAAGLAAPLVAARAVGGALGFGAAGKEARTAAAGATQEVGETAEKAAADQEAANLKEHAAAGDEVAKEAAKNHQAIAKAATDQGNANLKELGDAHKLASTKIREYSEGLDAKAQAIKEAVPKAQKEAVAEVAPEEAARQRADLIARTPEQTQAAQALPPAEAAARRQTFRESIFGPIQKRSDELGAQYEEHYQPHLAKPASAQPISAAADDEITFAKERAALTQPAMRVLDDAKKLSGAPPAPEILESQMADLFSGEGDKKIQAKFNQLYDDWRRENPESKLSKEDRRSMAQRAIGGEPEKPTTVQDVIRIRRAANKAMATERDWPSKSAMWRIVKSADQVLDSSDVPKPAGLNAEYKDFRDIFDHTFSRGASTTIEPADVSPKIFEEPQRALNLFRYASPQEAQTLRENFGDYVNTKGYSLADIGTKINPEVRRAVFGDSALAGKEPWLQMEPKRIELKTLVNSSPTARAQYSGAFSQRMDELERTNAGVVRKEGIALANQLGPAGKDIAAKLFMAKNPQEINAIAQKLAAMNPDEVVQGIASNQRSTGEAAFGESMVAKRTAREKFNQLRSQQKQPGQAAQEAVADLPTSAQAGRDALLNLKPSKGEEQLRKFLKFRTLWYGGTIFGGMMMGHVAPYALGMAGLDGAMSTFLGSRAIGRAMLRNPKIAELTWQALKAPKGIGGLQVAGKASAEIIAAMAAEKARNAETQQARQKEEATEARP